MGWGRRVGGREGEGEAIFSGQVEYLEDGGIRRRRILGAQVNFACALYVYVNIEVTHTL